MSGTTYANRSADSALLSIGMRLNPGERVLYWAAWSKGKALGQPVVVMILPVLWALEKLFRGQIIVFLIICAILAAIFALIYQSYKGKRLVVTNQRILFRRGLFVKHFSLIPLDKIEYIRTGGQTVTVRAGTFYNTLYLSVAEPGQLTEAIESARSSLSTEKAADLCEKERFEGSLRLTA